MALVAIRRFNKLIRVSEQFYYRSIAMSSARFEKALENLKKNPYYDKYANRIAALQNTSPDEFLARVEQQHKSKEEEIKKKYAPVDTRQFSSVLNPKEKLNDDVTPKDKNLDSIFKIDLVKDKDATEIKEIWENYHKNKDVISAAIPSNVYSIIAKNMQEYPTFLFPLPRSQGYEFIMSQVFGNSVHFTPLLAFQVHKENAPECLTMVHFTELKDKGLILMRGEYDKNVLNGKEAQCLANQFQMYYNGKDERRQELLESFTKQPNSFKHMDLISQLENIGIA